MRLLAAAAILLAGCAPRDGAQPPAAAPDPAVIVGKTWQAQDIAGGGVIDDTHVTLTLGTDGRASGDTGCNRFGGSYALEGAALTFGPLMSTKRGCPPALMTQEAKYTRLLSAVTGWHLETDGALTLTAPEGRILYRTEAP